jgi:hypothetical protein
MATYIVEDIPLVYGYPTKDEMERNKERFWVATKLYYIYGPLNSKTSLEHVQRRHLYTKGMYPVGKMAQCIWHEEFDKDLFTGGVGASIFLLKLHVLIHEDPIKRPLLASVPKIITSLFHNFELPDCYFRYEI